jgi:aldose 1-epimerase
MSYTINRGSLGSYETIIMENDVTGESAEIAIRGATLIKFNVPFEGVLFNIIDGFADEDEFESAGGARSWIMVPFANRIPEGKYDFKGKEYALLPVPPRIKVIHGFASYIDYEIESANTDDGKAEVVFLTKEIRPGAYMGYPFPIDVRVTYKLSENRLDIKMEAYNTGDEPAPFAAGWHPYFRTNTEGIEHLVFTLNAGKVINLDENSIPLPGDAAYSSVKNFPDIDFNDYKKPEERVIGNRILDHCYADIREDNGGISRCSLYDPKNGMEIVMFQEGGVTLAFSGDTLAKRKRMSVALEPMQAITNAFNREEYEERIAISPGGKSVFKFGVEVNQREKI